MAERPKKNGEEGHWSVLGESLRGSAGWLAAAVLLLLMGTALELLPHGIVYLVAEELLAQSPRLERLPTLALYCFGGVVLRFLLVGSAYLLSHRVAFAVMRSLRSRICLKLSRIAGVELGRKSQGDLKKLLIDDVAGMESIFAHFIPELLSALIVPCIASTILFVSDWRMGVLALVLMPVAVGIQAVSMRNVKQDYAQWHHACQRANQGILEFVRGVVVLKSFCRDASSLRSVSEGVEGVRDLAQEMTERTAAAYAVFFALLSGNLLVLLPGGLALLLGGSISAAQFLLLIILGTGLLMPLQRLMFLFGGLHRSNASLERIASILRLPEQQSDPEDHCELSNAGISIRNLCFSYPDAREPTLREVNLDLPLGSTTVLVGPSGCGKTTLLRMLYGYATPDRGEIYYGGRRYADLSDDRIRQQMSYVSQEIVLFDETVRENLLIARPQASQAELESATRLACAHDFILDMSEGYDSQLKDRGQALSGGERQRLSIARAILKDAPVLLLDEIASNVDPQSEAMIQESIRSLAHQKTVVAVAHRVASHRDADQIVVMNEGAVVSKGRHEELLATCEIYQRLWASQQAAQGWTLGASSC